jgi:hypothetical protein
VLVASCSVIGKTIAKNRLCLKASIDEISVETKNKTEDVI